ncbi:MAG: WD40/YVTN/BNR-like repeat-containing protein [Dehalococcoidia bacterium]
MGIMFGTSNGLWELTKDGCNQIGLGDKRVSHLANRDEVTLATVPHEGLYALTGSGERLVWQGDARACAIAPDGTFYVGSEPAMIFRSHDEGETWQQSDNIDTLPTRSDWYFPPPPHQPHVRSIDCIPGTASSILVGIEVGGVLLSEDGGESWEELNNGIYVDVHTVRPDPSQANYLVAVTGRGFYASEDGGDSWEKCMEGMEHRYTVGLHVNPAQAGELLVTAGEGPPGVNGCIYHSIDSGRNWNKLVDPVLPQKYNRVPVVLFADSSVWIATDQGQIFRADDTKSSWSLVGEIPAAISAASGGGSPSSIDSGHQ